MNKYELHKPTGTICMQYLSSLFVLDHVGGDIILTT